MDKTSTKNCRAIGIALTLGLGIAGCHGGHRTSLPHPATAGALTPATVVRNDFFAEHQLQLARHSLDDEVSLVRLDGAEVCFVAVLRGLEREARDLDLEVSRQDLLLRVGEVGLHPRDVIARPMEGGVVTGTEYQEQYTGQTEMVCTETSGNGSCLRYEEQAVTTTVAVAVDHAMVAESAMLCFLNDGSVTPSTGSVELWIGRAHFGFDFTDPAPVGTAWPVDAAGAPRVFVASGYEFLATDAPTSGGEIASAPPPPTVPTDLATIPSRALALADRHGRELLGVSSAGVIRVAGHDAAAHIDGGLIRNASDAPLIALGRDGSIWTPSGDHASLIVSARLDGTRISDPSGELHLWVDRRGAVFRQTGSARPERAEAEISPRPRSEDDRCLAALAVLMVADQLTWR